MVQEEGKERALKRSTFIANPFGFTKKLLGEKCSGQLTCPQNNITSTTTYSGGMREQNLGHCAVLKYPPEPSTLSLNSSSKGSEVIKSARTASAPGPNGVSYKVFKTATRLFELAISRKGKVLQMPKKENTSNTEQFRIISLLKVKCKTFFKIVANRLVGFLLKNTYVDTSV